MRLRTALLLPLFALLTACVTTGDVSPLSTSEGRKAASEAYVSLGKGYLVQGDSQRAKEPLLKALELDPASADANEALGMVFQIEMDTDLAESYYRKAISHSGGAARIYNNYASFLFEQKRYKEAYENFEKAAADTMYRGRSFVFESMGLTALKLNQPELASSNFQRSLRLNANQRSSLLEMAYIAYGQQQYVPARDYYERYRKLGDNDARGLLMGIRLATTFDDPNAASNYALQLKRLYPGSAEYQQYLLEKK
jgi:type IV pilus assembly protein PilF